MDPAPVAVGSMLFTQVQPTPGHERTFHRWYDRDHFLAGVMSAPWVFAGRRFVATRRLRALRFPATGPTGLPIDSGPFLAVCWITAGREDEYLAWTGAHAADLVADGRRFDERTSVHAAVYRHRATWYRDADPVPLELCLAHPYPGLVTLVVEATAPEPDEAPGAGLDDRVPDLLDGGSVSAASAWTVLATNDEVRPTGPVTTVLAFTEDDPATGWDAVRRWSADLERAGVGRVRAAGPWIPTVPGTDRYIDEVP